MVTSAPRARRVGRRLCWIRPIPKDQLTATVSYRARPRLAVRGLVRSKATVTGLQRDPDPPSQASSSMARACRRRAGHDGMSKDGRRAVVFPGAPLIRSPARPRRYAPQLVAGVVALMIAGPATAMAAAPSCAGGRPTATRAWRAFVPAGTPLRPRPHASAHRAAVQHRGSLAARPRSRPRPSTWLHAGGAVAAATEHGAHLGRP